MQTLYIDSLSKSYGTKRVLNNMTFQVNPGEIYGFVGSNGAGKSTTMRIALGVLAADSGEVRLGSERMNDTLRRTIGYMPEERGLYAKEKIADQLQFLGKLHGLSAAASKNNTDALLEQLGLADRRNDTLDSLSLGNQQRVQLAASLVHNPTLLILDEPFSGLDPVAVNVMSEMLKERAKQGVPVLFSSHQLDLVQRLCDRVGIITNGEQRAEGTVEELRQSGPIAFEILTEQRGWYPPGTRVILEEPNLVVLEAESAELDQAILQAAIAAGPVHGFTRRIPHLTDLFQEIVQP